MSFLPIHNIQNPAQPEEAMMHEKLRWETVWTAGWLSIASAVIALLLVGCGGSFTGPVSTPAPIQGAVLQGSVHGGQQPISGASLYLYAANQNGYAAANTSVLTAPVTTGLDGSFNITSKYTCTAGQQMYIVAIGGNPGAGTNAQAAIMAALGDCAGLSASTVINMNEVTTVASVFALSPFMTGYANVGSSASNVAGLVRAFASVNKLTNVATGSAPGSSLPAGATAPTAEIYSLADILAACVNSTGGVAGDGTACGTLFNLAKPTGGTAATDTIGLALAIAQNPALNVNSLFTYVTPISPFSNRLTIAPNDWSISINYTGFNRPKSTTIDVRGDVWIANSGSNTVSVLTQTGVPMAGSPLSGNGLNGPAAIAIDASGNAWVANRGGNTISVFTPTGGTFSVSPFTTGAGPVALAFDTPGNLWVVNADNSLWEFAGSGGARLAQTNAVTNPTAIAINPK